VEVTLLLCDAAQVAYGMLFVLGGGWNGLVKGGPGPITMGLAVLVVVPWNSTNEKHRLHGELVTEDGQPVDAGQGPVVVDGEFEVGRPAGMKPGASLNMPLALNLSLNLAPGSYRWQVAIDGSVAAKASFTVIEAPGRPQQ
jgi:hypothetical protein